MKQKLIYLFSLMLLSILGTSGAFADAVTYDAYAAHSSGIAQDAGSYDELEGIKVTYGSSQWVTGGGLTCGDVTYTGSLSAKSNSTVSGKTQTVGCIYLEPTVDGTVVFAATVNSDKAFYIFDETDETQITDFNPLCYYSSCLTDNEPKALYFNTSNSKLYEESTFATTHKMYGTVTFDVTAGHKYSVGVSGSKIGFHGFTFTPAEAGATPTITKDLDEEADVLTGIAQTFSIAATSVSSYQWYTCDNADGDNPVAIDGATSASYSYTAATAGTEYIYCAASNDNGPTLSTVCTVTATDPVPAITTDLSSEANAVVGVAKSFSIAATYADSYQWYTCDNADGDNPVAISGAQNDTYSYTAAEAGTVYIYCVASNAYNNSAESTICAVTAIVSSDDYNDTAATFAWTIGNESAATSITEDVADAVKSTKVKAGSDLTVTTASYASPGSGTLATYAPATPNAGNVAADMIEYTIKMQKGTTFTPTSVSYDAVKVGTDGLTFSWSYTVDGTESDIATISKGNIVRDNTNTPALRHTETITGAEAGQVVTVRFYASGVGNGKKVAIGNIAINGVVNGTVEQRTFTDFKVDFRTNPYTVVAPTTGELPSGVEVSYSSYNGAQHGVVDPTITVPVDGPVKFTIGACQYGSGAITITDADNNVINFSNHGDCGETSPNYNQNVTWTYNSETPTTLTFALKGYLPYFFAEACDYIEQCEVTYYDVDGKTTLKTETVDGGSELAYNSEATAAVTVADGYAFRGWFSDAGLTAVKVPEGTPVTEDLKLYAKATEVEVAEVGKIFTYELNKQYFYQEDHETFSASNGSFHDGTHGWAFGTNGSFSVDVAGNAQVVLGLCQYGNGGAINVTNTNGDDLGSIENAKVATDGATSAFNYTGEATTLTFTFTGGGYLHYVKSYNVNTLPAKDEATGYYIVPANDGASFLLALNSANAEGTSENPAKIFLPNGTYDLGNAVGTAISGSYVSIIGESQEGVVIQTTPEQEGLGTADLFLNTGSYNYFQDLTLKNNYPYGNTTGRAASFHDQGQYTIFKNCYLNSHQDTYYSHKVGAYFYFEGGKISGCVDYMCGNGKVFYEGVTLVNDNRSTYITANSELYVYNNCIVENGGSTYHFGRSWDGNPTCIFLNTTLKDNGAKLGSTRWVEAGMNTIYGRAGEYGTKNAEGTDITPESNVITFTKGTTSLVQNTILTAEEAATYSYENFFSSANWDPASVAAQETVVKTSVVNNVVTVPEGIYLVEKDGNFVEIFNGTSYTYDNKGSYTLRKANARGGFGEAVKMASDAAAPVQSGDLITLTVTANMEGNRAYVNTESNYTVSDDTEVYLPVSKTSGEVNLEKVDATVIAANYPVVLKAKNANLDGTYTITLTQTTDAASDLSGYTQYLNTTVEGTPVSGYRLGYKASSGVKFYKYVASAPEAGKIYLNLGDLPEDNSNTGNYLKIAFEQDATGINEVSGVDAGSVNGKFVKNGKLIIIKNGKSYNAAGAVLE